MICSNSHRFVFLHGRKTAGTSIGISLMRYLGDDDAVRGYITGGLEERVFPPNYRSAWRRVGPRVLLTSYKSWVKSGKDPALGVWIYRRYVRHRFGIGSTHLTCSEARELLGKDRWDAYFKFTFVRNPWDRMVSFYFWRVQELHKKPSFFEFVRAIHDGRQKEIEAYNAAGFSLVPFYTIADKRAVDFVGRYERLAEDLNHVARAIGIEFDGWLPHNKSGIRTASARNLYTPDTVEMVSRIAQQEVCDFGYRFEDT